MARERLGEILIKAGLLDEDGLQRALSEQKRWGGYVGQVLVRLGLVSEETLVRALSSQRGLPAVAIDPGRVDPAIARRVPGEICTQYQVLCFAADENGHFLNVAMGDMSKEAIEKIEAATRCSVRPYFGAPSAIAKTIAEIFGGPVTTANEIPEMPGTFDLASSEQDDERGGEHSDAGFGQRSTASGGGGSRLGNAKLGLDGDVSSGWKPAPISLPDLPNGARSLEVTVTAKAASVSSAAPLTPITLPPQGQPIVDAPPAKPADHGDDPVQDGEHLPSIALSDATGFHITMDLPAVEKEARSKEDVSERVARLESMLARNSSLLQLLLSAMVKKGLFTSEEIEKLFGKM